MTPFQKACIDTWEKVLPEYKIICWDENNSPMDEPYVSFQYKNGNWAFVSDFVRLYVVYQHGGIYLDTDVEVIRRFDDLLKERIFFGEESIGRLNSAIFGSQKRERILEACMNYMRRRHDLKLSVRLGPEIITEVYDDKKFPEVKVFPSEYFYPYNPYRKDAFPKLMYRDITERTMAIHHWEKTWKMNLLQRLLRKIF